MKIIKAKVYRLSSHANAVKGQLLFDGKQFSIAKGNMKYGFHHHTPQHLYITTDEEIKEGDWMWHKDLKSVMQSGKDLPKYNQNTFRKIIATTDSLLSHVDVLDHHYLPWIPQSFIEDYCKAEGIDEVLVEYIQNHPEPSPVPANLKLNPDNTIIIHPATVKEGIQKHIAGE